MVEHYIEMHAAMHAANMRAFDAMSDYRHALPEGPADTVASLREKFTVGRLSLEDFEKRVEVVLRAEEEEHGYGW